MSLKNLFLIYFVVLFVSTKNNLELNLRALSGYSRFSEETKIKKVEIAVFYFVSFKKQ